MTDSAGDAAMAPPVDVCVVIVHYETPDLLHECLDLLAASEDVNLQVIVVDNASVAFDSADVNGAYPSARYSTRPTKASLGLRTAD